MLRSEFTASLGFRRPYLTQNKTKQQTKRRQRMKKVDDPFSPPNVCTLVSMGPQMYIHGRVRIHVPPSRRDELGIVVRVCYSSTQKAEAG